MKSMPIMIRPRSGQSGAALIVVLLLLVIITLLGLAALRGAIMQERMAASTVTRNMAFQAAESGLRQAEIIVRDGATITFPSSGCASGRCAMPQPNAQPAWMASNFWSSGTGFQSGATVATSAGNVTPKFVIEDFGKSTNAAGPSSCIDVSKPCIQSTIQNIYRVTSYASMPNGAEVVVQSLYRR